MLNRHDTDAFFHRLLAGLTITVALVFGSLTHAVVNSQAFL